ncbi:MAG TPA: helix-turn-helix domain-containing protein [Bacteroidota bacterium]|nr:helix-turn-helix domain-containing protein [Bacteroidota bacterium]
MKDKNSYNVKLKIKLKAAERIKVKEILSKGKESVRVIKRVQVLDLFDQGYTSPTIAEYVGVTAETARRIGWNYKEGGLERAIYELSRPGMERTLSEKQANYIIAMVCTDPPEGRDRWTIRLITEESMKRKIVSSVGRETIRVLLKTHDLKPWREKNVVHSGIKRGIHTEDGKNT